MAKIDCAVILAGGKGTRLEPLTSYKPKPLVPVTLIPMIDFAIEQVRHAGIKKIVFAVKYLGYQIKQYLSENSKFDDLEIHVPEIDPVGTADAVRKLSKYIEGDFVVSMADIVSNMNLKKMIDFFYSTDAYATISLKNIDFPTKKFGVILLDEKQNIEIFLEKPRPEEMLFTTLAFAYRQVSEFHHNLVNTGVYIFKQRALEILDSFKDIDDFGQDLFPYLLQERFRLNGFVNDSYWMDCGNIRSYLWSNFDVLRGFVDGFAPPGKKENGNWIGENCTIADSAKLIAPVVLGNNVFIEDNSTVGPYSVIHDNVKINSNTIIDHSVIWEDSIIGKESFVHNSVICDKVELVDKSKIINYSAINN
ncbi:MAG: NDP-sugar synthase [Candidatus Heimdallarchaeota archaeon]|nr:NDP-sugar synthase [Candidatus Heimdallarchaeota archaeon]MCK4771079.1 NDP-sugar synthase [Candidatus Heimdallarchaeota archaeon]